MILQFVQSHLYELGFGAGLLLLVGIGIVVLLSPIDEAAIEVADHILRGQMDSATLSPVLASGSGPRDSHPMLLTFSGKDSDGKLWCLASYDKEEAPCYHPQPHRPGNLDELADSLRLGDVEPGKAPESVERLFNRLAYEESGSAIVCARSLRRNARKLRLVVKRHGKMITITRLKGGG